MTAPRRAQAPTQSGGLHGLRDWLLTAWQPAAIASAACLLVAGFWPAPATPPALTPEPAHVAATASSRTVAAATTKESVPEGEADVVTALEAPVADVASPTGPRLTVPAIGVSATVREVGVSEGELEIPDDPADVGIWRRGASPGDDSGTVLVTGHVSWNGQRGALWTLAATSPGDAVHLRDPAGGTSHWRVDSVASIPRDTDHPDLFTRAGEHRLVLVTCGGPLVGGHYRDLVVVVALPE